MRMQVNVELKDGSVCQMARQAFNVFLSLDRVVKFKRSDGWVVVGEGQMRELGKANDYPPVADRRASS